MFSFDLCKEKLKKFIPFCFTFLFFLLSPVHSYAAETNALENSWMLHNADYQFTMSFKENGVQKDFTHEPITNDLLTNNDYHYVFNNGSFWRVNDVSFYNLESRFLFEYAPDVYDYYFIAYVYQPIDVYSSSGAIFDLGNNYKNTTSLSFLYADFGMLTYDNLYSYLAQDVSVYSFTSDDTKGYTFVSRLPSSIPSSSSSNWPVGFRIHSFNSNGYDIGDNLCLKGLILALPIDSSESSFNSILSILQEIELDTSDILETLTYSIFELFGYGLPDDMGGSGSITGQDSLTIGSNLIGGNTQLDSFINQYTQVEQSMHDKFLQNQTTVSSNFSGWSWGSLATAVDWTSDYLNDIYDNSGDFRTMFMYPILAGIALIFIGRQGMSAYIRNKNSKGD